MQVALLANPSLQAKLEELAISQADLVQAGLLKNPTFSIGRTAWEAEHISPNLFASVEQDFLDIVTMPLRKRVAAAELEETKLEVADHVLELVARVREAFYNAQAAEQIVLVRRLVDDAAKTSSELARRQHEAGNMSDLTLSTELSLAAQTSVERKRAEGEAAAPREKLNKLMGVWGPRTAWKMGPRIPLFDQRQAQIARLEAFKRQGERELEALAVDVRADVRSSRARVLTARGLVEHYDNVVVPLRENVVRYSQEQYDAMLLGVYQLIQAKQAEFDAYREYIEALRDYWIARSDLERAAGARVGASPPAVANHPAAAVAPPPAHSH